MARSINPATDENIQTYPEMGIEETDRIINSTDNAFESWKKTDFSDRAVKMRNAAEILRNRKETLSILMT